MPQRAMATDEHKIEACGAPLWKAHISGFGKISEATIEMAPLVILVGKNNTGKSYVASLLWALLNFEKTFIENGLPKNTPKWFTRTLEEAEVSTAVDHNVSRSVLQNWLNRIIADRAQHVVKAMLSYSEAKIDGLSLSFPSRFLGCNVRRLPFPKGETHSLEWDVQIAPGGSPVVEFNINPDEEHRTWAASSVFTSIVSSVMAGAASGNMSSDAKYIPAARTGLMLALDSLVTSALETFGLDRTKGGSALPLPIIRFLQAIARQGRSSDEFADIATFLEAEVLGGRIVREKATTPKFTYQAGEHTHLPLHVTSSMITELAPFLILLRTGSIRGGLIFEEPEAHLHLSAQRQVARAIARLVNRGVPVVVTTHSDTLIQEINILLQLSSHPKRRQLLKSLGYLEEDVLRPNDVRAYEFRDKGGQTVVTVADMSDGGLIIESLNETLVQLADEVIAVQDER